MSLPLRAFLVAFCVGVAWVLAQFGLLASLDHVLQEQRYAWTSRAPSGDIVLVEIDSASLQAIDSWPWPRSNYGNLLDLLMDWGADEVVFDIDFSSYSSRNEDQALTEALTRAGGYAYLAAFEQVSGINGEITLSTPNPDFLAVADAVLVNVFLDRWGLVRSFPTRASTSDSPIISLATVLAQPGFLPPPRMYYDFSIDLDAVKRFSFARVLAGQVDATEFAGKQVVVGASAVELRDIFSAPRFGLVPGPLLQILGAETLKSNRIVHNAGFWPSLVFGLFAGALVWFAVRRHAAIGGAAVVVAMVVWETAAIIAYAVFGIMLDTGAAHICLPLLFSAAMFEQAAVWLSQRLIMQRRLEYMARHDERSGAFSRAGFTEAVERDLVPAGQLFVLLVRIERLNMVRGSLGQEVSNLVLAEVARRLDCIAPQRVGHVATDVFALAFQTRQPDHDGARYREQVSFAITEPVSIGGHTIIIDCTMAASHADSGLLSVEQLIGEAEITLDQFKSSGRGDIHLFKPEYAKQISERRILDADMREGLKRSEFRLMFQPQIHLRTRRLVGAEALIRWQHPERGEISPVQFIGPAEESGFIVELGEWVMREACAVAAPWRWAGTVSVNVSAVQMEFSDVLSLVKSTLSDSGLTPTQLEVEITESVMADKTESVIRVLTSLRRMGVAVAIDDFGTGYSALSYLNELPFDTLKIDQSFVHKITSHSSELAVVETIASLASRLNKSVVVEGVETATQDRLLTATECDIGQGYYYSRPVEAHILTAHINLPRKASGK